VAPAAGTDEVTRGPVTGDLTGMAGNARDDGTRDDTGAVVVIGAGPAGLTAAYQLVKAGRRPIVAEADDVVGGLSRTVVRDGWRLDLGGHRFFTTEPRVDAMWQEVLSPEEFPVRRRRSHILYRGHRYEYPLRAANVLAALGPLEATRCVLSYLRARLRPPEDQSNYEGWLVARFGRRLYRRFFEPYTEKVWGVPPCEMPADWAAQRVRDLDLWRAVRRAVVPGRQPPPTSLVEEFRYPRWGSGTMWERCRALVEAGGGTVELSTTVVAVHVEHGAVSACTLRDPDGSCRRVPAAHVVSSMPLRSLVAAMDPLPPPEVQRAAADLSYRDFLVVALVVPADRGFADQWIYVHTPEVAVGRIQNFGSWSAEMVKPGRTCLGLEYFVSEGDALWSSTDRELVDLATRELATIDLAEPHEIEQGFVVRVPKAYPFYDRHYRANVETVAHHLARCAPNLHPVGRNGMHRYNNQDHSMLSAMLAVENILGAHHDVWSATVGHGSGEPREGGAVAAGA
jgi:protoporphyrinogen oxidase